MKDAVSHALLNFLRYNNAYLAKFTNDTHETPQSESYIATRFADGDDVQIRVTQSLYPIGGRFDTENFVKQTLFRTIAKLTIRYNTETQLIDVDFDSVQYEKSFVTKIDDVSVTLY